MTSKVPLGHCGARSNCDRLFADARRALEQARRFDDLPTARLIESDVARIRANLNVAVADAIASMPAPVWRICCAMREPIVL